MTRYVSFELIILFAGALIGFTGALLLGGAAKEAIDYGLPPAATLRLMPYLLLEMLRISVPVTLLLASTSVYSRMSGFNEIVAIKALGISPMAVLWPAFALGFVVSLAAVWLNDVAVSWGRIGAQRVIIDAVEEIAYGMLRTEHCYSSGQFSINVKGVNGRTLLRPTVSFMRRGSMPALMVDADAAELRSDHEENVLKIFLRNARIEAEGGIRFFSPEFDHEIPLSDASRADEHSRHPSCLPMSEIDEEIARQHRILGRRKEQFAARSAYQHLTGEFDDLAGPSWIQRRVELEDLEGLLARLRSEPYRRWSAGFSCLCFVWIGAPMAIWLRNRDFLQSFFLCFAPILIVYYPVFMVTIKAAKNGTAPAIAVWAGNLILAIWGAWVLRRVLRYSSGARGDCFLVAHGRGRPAGLRGRAWFRFSHIPGHQPSGLHGHELKALAQPPLEVRHVGGAVEDRDLLLALLDRAAQLLHRSGVAVRD